MNRDMERSGTQERSQTLTEFSSKNCDLDQVVALLEEDKVVFCRGMSQDNADELMFQVAKRFNLDKSLEIQAGFASIQGHRSNVGKYYMTVNNRSDYQIITPHSEGTFALNFQLASFFAYENTTDGAETLLLNVNSESEVWKTLREAKLKRKTDSRQLSSAEIAKAKMIYGHDFEKDVIVDDDIVLEEVSVTGLPNFSFYRVLSRPIKMFSQILNRSLYAYTDSVASIDFDCLSQFIDILVQDGIIKIPPYGLDAEKIDLVYKKRRWRSGVKFDALFKNKIAVKLQKGDYILFNNITWCHSVTNWTPASGQRRVVAAFA